jgi:hypothetical protein
MTTVVEDMPARDAARVLAAQDLPGLVVVDGKGRPLTVLAGTQVLRMALPSYCQDDPALARVIDEAAADVVRDHTGRSARPDARHLSPSVRMRSEGEEPQPQVRHGDGDRKQAGEEDQPALIDRRPDFPADLRPA